MSQTPERERPLAIHWFRRNLRLEDNRALADAAHDRQVLPVFVIDDEQMRDERMGAARARYQAESLAELDGGLRRRGSALLVRRGDPAAVLSALAKEVGADLVTAVADVTPFNRAREAQVADALRPIGGTLELSSELYFTSPAVTTRDDGHPFTVFSPYQRRFTAQLEAAGPGAAAEVPSNLLAAAMFPDGAGLPTVASLGFEEPAQQLITGGERAAQQRLSRFVNATDGLARYDELRNLPAHQTSRLSADLHFGTLSIRSVLRAALSVRAATSSPGVQRAVDRWVSELCWRDFYAAVMHHFPTVRELEFREDMRDLPWEDDAACFTAWCEGRTGYPIVDAAMRQLNTTGWMHNRCRMIVASFLTKDLHLDWRLGEGYFLEQLVDADVSNNNGGWQWAASTGTDPQPYFRIFNPVLQGEKFDPDGTYVRSHVPELAQRPSALIHHPRVPGSDQTGTGAAYPPPIVDHAVERQAALAAYQSRSARPAVRARR